MSAERYFAEVEKILDRIKTTQTGNIQAAALQAASSIAAGGLVFLFGSGHSVIPLLDIFPRYGGFVGFQPLMDARLMWTQVLGSGGVRELLKLERTEGYIGTFLSNFKFEPVDTMMIFSHGGLNAAGIETAITAREAGMKVIAVTSLDNAKKSRATHSTGKKLVDLADLAIDNCCPPEDAVVEAMGTRVAASSTLAIVAISMALVAETAVQLERKGHRKRVFVSPNVASVGAENNQMVFDEYVARIASRLK